jgi:hypothetical protein
MSRVLPIVDADDYDLSQGEGIGDNGERKLEDRRNMGGSFRAPTSVSTVSVVSPPRIYPGSSGKVPRLGSYLPALGNNFSILAFF